LQDIPTIDLSGLDADSDDGDGAALAALAAEIGAAARGIGFFRLTSHGIDADLIGEVFAQSERFFALPLAAKVALSITRSPHNRGYVGIEGERLDESASGDLKEAFNIGLDLAPDDPRVVGGEPFRGVNVWPDLPGWRQTMLAYYDAVWALGRGLHRAVAVDLGLAPGFFEDKLDQPLAVLRLLHYPPQPAVAEPGQIGAGEHTDYGNITLLLTDAAGGLEVRTRQGAWIAVPPLPGTFVINIGDCLMRWTNDIYVSTPHRVVNSSGRERTSVAFFLYPNPEVEIVCLPTCVAPDRPARYPQVSGAAYLAGRLARTYDYLDDAG
jgi:isopenicillin N synthase-like dioxygenase